MERLRERGFLSLFAFLAGHKSPVLVGMKRFIKIPRKWSVVREWQGPIVRWNQAE
jgi:hypothetical protein